LWLLGRGHGIERDAVVIDYAANENADGTGWRNPNGLANFVESFLSGFINAGGNLDSHESPHMPSNVIITQRIAFKFNQDRRFFEGLLA
jgi:hypothetical protein